MLVFVLLRFAATFLSSLSGGEIRHILVHYLFALGLERSTSPYSFGGIIRWLLCSSGWLQFVICEVFISPSINHPVTSINTNLSFPGLRAQMLKLILFCLLIGVVFDILPPKPEDEPVWLMACWILEKAQTERRPCLFHE